MKTVADIELGALDAVNAAYRAYGLAPLRALPAGLVRNAEECSVQRALRALKLGPNVRVLRDRITGIRLEDTEMLRTAWGNPGRRSVLARLNPGEVALPPRLRRFVRCFDWEHMLHLKLEDIMEAETCVEEPVQKILQPV
jgi:hypothetical protein